jgi:hypothetical protein
MNRQRGIWQGVAALAASVLCLAVLWPRAPVLALDEFDQGFYLGIAADMTAGHGFTDGPLFGQPGPDGVRPPGMRFAPLYPALLWAAAQVDPPFAQAMACVAAGLGKGPSNCPRDAALVRGVQFALLAGFYWLVWWTSGRVSGSARVRWLAFVISLLTAPFLVRSVNETMTEVVALALVTGAIACCVEARAAARPAGWLLVAGVLIGATALTKPAFQALYLAGSVAGLVLAFRRGLWRPLAAFTLGGAAVMAPWILRNGLTLGHFAISFGYDSHTLVQRVSFNSMTWREWAMSFLCWLPDGSGMGSQLFGRGVCTKFMWNESPDTFYMVGMTTLMQETVAAAGGWEHHLGYLLREYIIPHAVWHAMVSIPFALRGAWIDHYWGFVLAPICAVVTWRAARRGDAAMLLVTLPGWFMLALHSAVAVNQVRYNLMLVLPFSLAGALAADAAWAKWPLWRGTARAW